ncbi:MAG: hypothetical protein P4L95_23815 [Rouxiella aceris]|uniref:hypothetical protein n=1 Tax=Rouxiella aceris TaxID=2703884 RepID=UPI00284F4BD4|nr:hypothetical protein [Rouxiella aceris]MDR3434894.1 hypothetical protein [Rouxiella aceris]
MKSTTRISLGILAVGLFLISFVGDFINNQYPRVTSVLAFVVVVLILLSLLYKNKKGY